MKEDLRYLGKAFKKRGICKKEILAQMGMVLPS